MSMPHGNAPNFDRYDSYYVQHGDSATLVTRWQGPSVIVERWEGYALRHTGVVRKFPATPEGEQAAAALARELQEAGDGG